MRNGSYWAAASALAAGLMLSVPAAAVPIVLTGNHVKVDISDAGTFGSNGNADPAFVHDPSGTGSFLPELRLYRARQPA